jgi:hypothetical protein
VLQTRVVLLEGGGTFRNRGLVQWNVLRSFLLKKSVAACFLSLCFLAHGGSGFAPTYTLVLLEAQIYGVTWSWIENFKIVSQNNPFLSCKLITSGILL